MMDTAEIRLELLRLCHRHDRDAEEIINRACKLESYVLSSEASGGQDSVKRGPGRPPEADKAQDPA